MAERPAEKKIIVGGVLAPARPESRPRRTSSVSRVRQATSFSYRSLAALSVGSGGATPATFVSASRTAAGDVGSVRTVESGIVRSATRSVGGIAFRYWSIACFINRSFPGRNDPSSITRNVVRPSRARASDVGAERRRQRRSGRLPASPDGAVVASTRSSDVSVRWRPSTRSCTSSGLRSRIGRPSRPTVRNVTFTGSAPAGACAREAGLHDGRQQDECPVATMHGRDGHDTLIMGQRILKTACPEWKA